MIIPNLNAVELIGYLASLLSIRFPEIEAAAAPGDIIGEIGVFSPGRNALPRLSPRAIRRC